VILMEERPQADEPLDLTGEDALAVTEAPSAEADIEVEPGQAIDVDMEEDRYHRLRLIQWWDQTRLQNARVMVVGAGALGNEILKNLALLGVGKSFIVDLDTIEESNLTRSVLYRAADNGQEKAATAARAAIAA